MKDWHPAWWEDPKYPGNAPKDDIGLADLRGAGQRPARQHADRPQQADRRAGERVAGAVQGLMQTYQNEAYADFSHKQDAEYQRRYDASFNMPGHQGDAERNMINYERPGVATSLAEHLKTPVDADFLPKPPPLPEVLQATAERMAERNQNGLDHQGLPEHADAQRELPRHVRAPGRRRRERRSAPPGRSAPPR